MNEDRPGTVNDDYSAWKGWNEHSGFGSCGPGEIDYFTRELKEAIGSPHPVHDVLEVGFGNGEFLGFCTSQGWNVQGTELSDLQVEIGMAAGFAVHGVDHVGEIPDGSLDLVAAFDVLEHIPQDNAIGFLSELAAKLRPTGAMVLRYPNSDSPLSNPLQYGDPTHVTQIGYYKMTYFAAQSGLEIVAYRGPVRRGFKSSAIHGLHRLTAGPIIAASAALKKALYFPGLPIVLSSHDVVCVLRPITR